MNIKLVLITLLATSLVGGSYFVLTTIANRENISSISSNDCLKDNEYADYPLDPKSNPILKIPKEYPVKISIRDKNTGIEKSSFIIEDIIEGHYHPIEVHNCRLYAVVGVNYKMRSAQQNQDFKVELREYDYNGVIQEKILLVNSEIETNPSKYFAQDFRVSYDEKYVGLRRGYLDGDYFLVVRSLDTLKDVFTISLEEITAKDQNIFGDIGLNWWSDDSRYFWANIFQAADVLAFIRIDTTDWSWELFSAPLGTMGGDALNPNTGWVTYDVGAPWTADPDFDASYQRRMEREGNLNHFYIYNLLAKKQILLETISDHNWNFQPRWLSDIELEYSLPDGTKKIYTIK